MEADEITIQSRKHGPRIFRKTGERPHVNRHGYQTAIATWQGSCVVCGAPFEDTTPARFDRKNPRYFQLVHCHEHKRKRAVELPGELPANSG